MSLRFGKSRNTRDSSSEMMAVFSSFMKCSVYGSRSLPQRVEWMSAGTSSLTSASYSGYQYSEPSAGGGGLYPSFGSGFSRQPTKPSSLTQRVSSSTELAGLTPA